MFGPHEEMKGSQLRELKTLYNRTARMLEDNELRSDRQSEESKEVFLQSNCDASDEHFYITI